MQEDKMNWRDISVLIPYRKPYETPNFTATSTTHYMPPFTVEYGENGEQRYQIFRNETFHDRGAHTRREVEFAADDNGKVWLRTHISGTTMQYRGGSIGPLTLKDEHGPAIPTGVDVAQLQMLLLIQAKSVGPSEAQQAEETMRQLLDGKTVGVRPLKVRHDQQSPTGASAG